MFAQYKIKPIILLDEYDAPLDHAFRNGFFKDFIGHYKNIFYSSLKGNPYCGGSVVTGCLQIFTGFNNLFINNVKVCNEFTTAFGFTAKEVHDMLVYYDLQDKEAIMQDWYDGYRFNDIEIYNPFSVVNQIGQFVLNKNANLENSWVNSSENVILKQMLSSCAQDESLKDKFEILVNQGKINIDYSTTVTYDSMLEDVDAIFGTLLFTGYLTLDKEGSLYVPNKEVLSTFRKLVNKYNEENIKSKTPELVNALEQKKPLVIEGILEKIIKSSLSYYDVSSEAFAHGFLAGILSQTPEDLGWSLDSNKESGLGRFDIAFINKIKGLAIIIEIKRAKEKPRQVVEEAIKQMVVNDYQSYYSSWGFCVIEYALCFHEKSAYAKIITDQDRAKYKKEK